MVKTSRPAQHNSSNGWEFSGGSKEISYLWYKIALSTALILIGLGIYWMDPAFFPRAFSLSVRGDIQGTVEYLRSFGVKAAWVSLLLLTIINMLGFLPNIFLIVANGFLFGIVPGILISWAGECLGAALGFFATAIDGGMFCGALLCGALAESAGYRIVFPLLAMAMLVVLLLCLRQEQKAKERPACSNC